jgi:hypothetical protein
MPDTRVHRVIACPDRFDPWLHIGQVLMNMAILERRRACKPSAAIGSALSATREANIVDHMSFML